MQKQINRMLLWCVSTVAVAAQPMIAKADIVLGNGFQTAFGYNYNSNSGQLEYNLATDTSPGFGSSNTIGDNYAAVSYAYSQNAGIATLAWNVRDAIPPGDNSAANFYVLGETDVKAEFVPTTDELYSFSSLWHESGTSGYSISFMELYDTALPGYRFQDYIERYTIGGVTTTNISNLGSDTGMLLAGHQYVLAGDTYLLNDNFHDNNRGIADGSYLFQTRPVPEPTSFALMGLGGFGIAIATLRRRSPRSVVGIV